MIEEPEILTEPVNETRLIHRPVSPIEPFGGLRPLYSVEAVKQRLQEFQAFVKDYMKDGEDMGTIPGTPKPTLLKPGADKLCELYGLSDEYEILQQTEDWNRAFPLFDYTIRCTLRSIRHGLVIASGMGSCNSYESKYRWREGKRVCPQCEKEAIIKGKEEYGGGWLCFHKKGGCGAKFPDNDQEILSQKVGRVENDDIATQKNTLLKMAKKRAKVDAVLAATRSSGIFTQDLEDIENHEAPAMEKPKPRHPQRKSELPLGQGTIDGIQLGNTKKKQPYVLLTVNGKKLWSFDNFMPPGAQVPLWEFLGVENGAVNKSVAVGQTAHFIVEPHKEFPKVVGVRRIGEREWQEEITQEDIPF